MALERLERGRATPTPRLSLFLRAVGYLVRVLEGFCAALVVVMAVVVLTGVFYRYVLQRALPWYDEVAEYLLVWLTFYGSVLVSQRNAHIGFETLTDALPPQARHALLVVSEVIVLVIQAALFYYGWKLVAAASFSTAVSARWIRLSWVYSAIPLGGGLMFLIGLRRLLARGASVRP